MSSPVQDMLTAVRAIRERNRRADLAARAVSEPPRQGLLALVAADQASDDRAVLGITDADVDDDVVDLLAHRTQRRPS